MPPRKNSGPANSDVSRIAFCALVVIPPSKLGKP